MEKWFSGISYEIAFWNSLFANRKGRERMFQWSKYNSEIDLLNFEVQKFLLSEENPVIIDAGCGMSYCTGNKLNGKEINIHYFDPLAPFYNRIIDKKRLDLPKIEFGFIEYLSAFYPQSNVSLIIVQNALDHCDNPLKGILECIEALKIGGVLYLKHKPNEAKAENYRGFHQYNITIEDDELVLWNKETRVSVNQVIASFAGIETSFSASEPIAVITKKQKVSSELLDDKKDKLLLCNHLMLIIEKFNQPSFAFKYHVKFVYFRVIQFFMRFFSYKFRERLKKIIRRK